jgi:peroxiredoxin
MDFRLEAFYCENGIAEHAGMPSLADAVRDAFAECREMDASLGDRLDAFADSLRRIDPAFSGAVDRLVSRLRQAKVGAGAPKIGDNLPPFYLPDQRGLIVSLPEVIATGPLAVVVHRGHWCPYCRINTRSLAEAQPRIEAAGGRVVAIVPDRQRYAEQIREEAEGKFPILVDVDNGYTMSLNLVFWVGEEMRRFMTEAGVNLAEYQGNDSWTVPVPATFVVGKGGVIRERFVDPDYRKRMTVETMLQAFHD